MIYSIFERKLRPPNHMCLNLGHDPQFGLNIYFLYNYVCIDKQGFSNERTCFSDHNIKKFKIGKKINDL